MAIKLVVVTALILKGKTTIASSLVSKLLL